VPTGLASAKVFLTPDRPGNYVFQLVVDDGLFQQQTASVTVVVGLGGSVLVPNIVGQTSAATSR